MELASTLKSSRAAAKLAAPNARSNPAAETPASDRASAPKNTTPRADQKKETPRSTGLEQELKKALSNLGLPTDSFRMELSYSQDTGRVVARVLDKDNGTVLREIPSKELQRLFSQMRDFVGALVDKKA